MIGTKPFSKTRFEKGLAIFSLPFCASSGVKIFKKGIKPGQQNKILI